MWGLSHFGLEAVGCQARTFEVVGLTASPVISFSPHDLARCVDHTESGLFRIGLRPIVTRYGFQLRGGVWHCSQLIQPRRIWTFTSAAFSLRLSFFVFSFAGRGMAQTFPDPERPAGHSRFCIFSSCGHILFSPERRQYVSARLYSMYGSVFYFLYGRKVFPITKNKKSPCM